MIVQVETRVAAPADVCFDLARDIDFHVQTMRKSGERTVAGRAHGLIELGESVTWEGQHLGVRQRLTVRITGMKRPMWFRDEMTRGAFAAFCHDHDFTPTIDGTVMVDRVSFRSPLGPLGQVMGVVVLRPYLHRLIRDRAEAIRVRAETR